MARLCSYPSLILPWGFRGLVICSYASFIFFSWCFKGCQLVDKLSWHGCPCQFTVRVFWCQSLGLALCFTLGYQFCLFLPNVSFSLCRIMPGAARGAPASATSNGTPVTDGESHTQITPQEALLSSQFMETLVNRVAHEVFRRLAPAPTPPAPTPPVPTSDLQEVPAGPLGGERGLVVRALHL